MLRKIAITSFLFLCLIGFAEAQRYGTAVGLRFGNSNLSRTVGITAQQRIMERISVEAILQSDFKFNSNLSLLLEKHHPIISKRFNYYYGAGVSFGKEESMVKDETNMQVIQTYGNATTGIDLIGGVELTLMNTVISLDYKPNFNLAGREEFYRGQMGISARMVLVKSKEQKKKQRQRARTKRRADKPSFGEQVNSIFRKN